jgi:hypothetical protein
MKNLFLLAFLILSFKSFAGLDKGVRDATLRANRSFNLSQLDQVGTTVKNSKTGEVLYHHCSNRDKAKECTEIIHILRTEEKNLIVHSRQGLPINQDVLFLKMRLEMEGLESVSYFNDFDSNYQRSAGDFTGHIGGICIYEPKRCSLLLLLPFTIVADLVMLPVDITVNGTQRILTRHRAKLFMQQLESEQESIEISHRAFNSLLKGLSQF